MLVEILIGAVILLAVVALVADRYGEGGVEVIAFLVLLGLDLVMMAGLVVVAGAENCSGSSRWECSRAAEVGLALGVPAATLSLIVLLVRARN